MALVLLASHALAAGPLAASQPGFTVLDRLSVGLLGVFLFDEHIKTGVLDLAGEALALAVVIAGAGVGTGGPAAVASGEWPGSRQRGGAPPGRPKALPVMLIRGATLLDGTTADIRVGALIEEMAPPGDGLVARAGEGVLYAGGGTAAPVR